MEIFFAEIATKQTRFFENEAKNQKSGPNVFYSSPKDCAHQVWASNSNGNPKIITGQRFFKISSFGSEIQPNPPIYNGKPYIRLDLPKFPKIWWIFSLPSDNFRVPVGVRGPYSVCAVSRATIKNVRAVFSIFCFIFEKMHFLVWDFFQNPPKTDLHRGSHCRSEGDLVWIPS